MKKTTLLSFATAAAIVVTSTGTFAVWDTMSSDATNTLTVTSPKITVNAGTLATFTSGNDVAGADSIEYTSSATFKVDGKDNISKVIPTVVVTDDNDAAVSGATATIVNPDAALAETMTYNVKVVVTDKSLAGKELKVKVTATAQAV